MITFRIYVVNRDSKEIRELGVEVYEPSANARPDPGNALQLPPCACPRCRTEARPAPQLNSS